MEKEEDEEAEEEEEEDEGQVQVGTVPPSRYIEATFFWTFCYNVAIFIDFLLQGFTRLEKDSLLA